MASEIVPFIDKDQLATMREFVDYLKTNSALPANENAGQVMMKLQAAKDMGLTPTQALTGIAFVNGKLAVFGAAAASLMVKHGYNLSWGECTDKVATLKVSKEGRGEHPETFTIEDARKAGLAGKPGPWTLYTRDMLRWKALARARNFFCPEVGGGLPIKEDYQELETVTQPIDEAKIREEQERAIETVRAKRRAAKVEAQGVVEVPKNDPAGAMEAIVEAAATAPTPEEIAAAAPVIIASKEQVAAFVAKCGGEKWAKKHCLRTLGHDSLDLASADDLQKMLATLEPRPVDETLEQVAAQEQGQPAKNSTVERIKAAWLDPSLSAATIAQRSSANALDRACAFVTKRTACKLANLTPTESEQVLSAILERNAASPKK